MSREIPIELSSLLGEGDDAQADDLGFQINIRLQLDEVAQLEAKLLKQRAARAPTRKELCRLACRLYDSRRTRDKMLGRALFGEPAWDMLLALYCLPARGEILGTSALSFAADTAQTTGLRWQQMLTEKGLIERGPSGLPMPKQMVRLTSKGRELMEGYLTRLYYCDTPVPPHPERAGG